VLDVQQCSLGAADGGGETLMKPDRQIIAQCWIQRNTQTSQKLTEIDTIKAAKPIKTLQACGNLLTKSLMSKSIDLNVHTHSLHTFVRYILVDK
jgi:hypothetical protein